MLKLQWKLSGREVKFIFKVVSQGRVNAYGQTEKRDGFEIKYLIPSINTIAEQM